MGREEVRGRRGEEEEEEEEEKGEKQKPCVIWNCLSVFAEVMVFFKVYMPESFYAEYCKIFTFVQGVAVGKGQSTWQWLLRWDKRRSKEEDRFEKQKGES